MKWNSCSRLASSLGVALVLASVGCADAITSVPETARAVTSGGDIVLPGSGKFTPLADRPTANTFGCAVKVSGGILVAGGNDGATNHSGLLRYDVASNTWSSVGSHAATYSYCAFEKVGSAVYLMETSFGGETLLSVNTSTYQTTQLTSSPSDQFWYATAATATHLYRIGGYASTAMLRYNPASDTWTTLASLPHEKYFHHAVAVGEKIYVMGGFSPNLIYDIPSDTWSPWVGGPVISRPTLGVIDSVIYVFDQQTFAYDIAANTWTTLNSNYGASNQAGVVYGRRIFLSGGHYYGFLARAQWFTPASTGNHAPRADFGMYGSRVENSPILFDNVSADPDGDAVTYEWDFGDGTTSTEEDPVHAFTAVGVYTVTLTVSDASTTTVRTRIARIVGEQPWLPSIEAVSWSLATESTVFGWSRAGGSMPTSYEVERRVLNGATGAFGAWTAIDTVQGDVNEVTDTEATVGGGYQYRVRACRSGSCSGWVFSPVVSTETAPDRPANFQALHGTGNDVVLTWAPVAGAISYVVERRERVDVADPWSAWAVDSIRTDTTYVDNDFPDGGRYLQYRVKACSSSGCSVWAAKSITLAF